MRESTAFERIAGTYPDVYYCEAHPQHEALGCIRCSQDVVARQEAVNARFEGTTEVADPDADYQKLKDHPSLIW